jgi:hypothetical protein
MTIKQQVIEAIHRLPEDIDFRDVAEEVAFLKALNEADRDIEEGRVVSNEEMRSRIAGDEIVIGRVWPAALGEADLERPI